MARPRATGPALERLGPTPFREPIVPVSDGVETPTVSFADLVRLLAEGIADAQSRLDRASAELVTELAETEVEVVPRITERIDADGNITYEEAPTQRVSLLSLGVTPTFYQFSQATVEVVMDVKVVEQVDETAPQRRRFGLFADTSSVRMERKLNRSVTTSSKLTATLVPVPMPLRLQPERTTAVPPVPPRG